MMGFKSPNYTQVPNDLFDEWMRVMDAAEFKVVCYIMRTTIGYHKAKQKLSLSVLCTATGMAKETVFNGLQKAVDRGLLRKTIEGGMCCWEPIIDAGTEIEPPEEQIGTEIRPESVQKLDTLKERKKDIKDTVPEKPPERDIKYHTLTEIKMFYAVTGRWPRKEQNRPALELIRAGNYTFEEMKRGFDAWVAKGWSPFNLGWIQYSRTGIPAWKKPEQPQPIRDEDKYV
jgi:hypothetical protein